MTFREPTSSMRNGQAPAGEPLPTIRILGARVDNLDHASALQRVVSFATSPEGTRTRTVFFTNVHSIVTARRDSTLSGYLDEADLVLPDGSGLKLAGKAFRTPITTNLNGTDFTPLVLREAVEHNLTVYLLGTRPEVLDACVRKLKEDFAGLQILGARSGYFDEAEEAHIIHEINEKRPNILLVAMGTPLQERWASTHAEHLQAGVCLTVGGLFDFIAGHHKRAPRWMRSAGLEWIYRFLQDPQAKWPRVFIETPLFLTLVAVKVLRSQFRSGLA